MDKVEIESMAESVNDVLSDTPSMRNRWSPVDHNDSNWLSIDDVTVYQDGSGKVNLFLGTKGIIIGSDCSPLFEDSIRRKLVFLGHRCSGVSFTGNTHYDANITISTHLTLYFR